ncbi:unnamed protein product [Euphydryas editha]|uniref:Uncharacterized protein n=1 Tax=Euphydryas editha TaxID=104508 RepID=A0AAU9UIW2_EUPED|nr:unnamed protein product [Euphydryas editha]
MSDCCEQSCGMYTTWYSRGEGMHHHQMGQLYHGAPMIKTEAGVNSDCMMAVDYAPPIKVSSILTTKFSKATLFTQFLCH